MEKLQFYHIKDEYIEYLHQFFTSISCNFKLLEEKSILYHLQLNK